MTLKSYLTYIFTIERAALQCVFAFLAFSEQPSRPAEFQRTALAPWFNHDCRELFRHLLDVMPE